MRARLFFCLVTTTCAISAGVGWASPPAREPIEKAVSRNASCVSCHAAEAATWEKSQHHGAASDPSFKTAIAIEPLAFCRGCHAPAADPQKPTPAAAEQLGIGCIHCHESTGATATGKAHGTMTNKSCASCHEFAFPNPPTRLMQSTHEEHKASAFAQTACTECHMRRDASGHADHASIVSSDTEMLKRAVNVRVTRAGESRVAIRITPGAVGHAFPTGDLFRRLRASVRVVASDGKVVAERHRYLMRHFGVQRSEGDALVRVETKDDRPGARDAQACFELALGKEAAANKWNFDLAYQRVDHPRSESDLDKAVVAQNTVLFAQELDSSFPEEPCPK